MCAPQNMPCKCNGQVKYGNFESFTDAAKWTSWQAVQGSIDCNDAKFSAIKSGAKICWCRPWYVLDWVAEENRSSKTACDTGITGYTLPKCVVQMVKVDLGMKASGVYELGYNRGAASALLSGLLDKYLTNLTTMKTEVADFNKATLGSMLRMPCENTTHCMSLIKKLDTARADSKLLSDMAKQYITDTPQLGSSMIMMKPLVSVKFMPEKVGPTATGTNSSICEALPTAEPYNAMAANGASSIFLQASAAMISLMLAVVSTFRSV